MACLGSEEKPGTGEECPFAGILRVEIERIQSVILIAQIQDADTHLDAALKEPMASEEIELPKIVAGQFDGIPLALLMIPEGFQLREKPAIEEHPEIATELVKGGGVGGIGIIGDAGRK